MAKVNNIKSWAGYTEPSYPLLLISYWIPFNAWYISTTGLQKDRDCLMYFKRNPDNKVYQKIKQLLDPQNKSYEGISFKHEFVRLDNLLKHGNFPDTETPILFGVIEMQANATFENQKIVDGIKYVARRYKEGNEFGKPAKSIDVIKENLATHEAKTIHLNKHDINQLKEEFKKNNWTRDNKKVALEMFKSIEPVILKDVKETSSGRIKIEGSSYTNDYVVLAAAIVDVLYDLRCKAVHGEVEINSAMLKIYEHAFALLKILVTDFY